MMPCSTRHHTVSSRCFPSSEPLKATQAPNQNSCFREVEEVGFDLASCLPMPAPSMALCLLRGYRAILLPNNKATRIDTCRSFSLMTSNYEQVRPPSRSPAPILSARNTIFCWTYHSTPLSTSSSLSRQLFPRATTNTMAEEQQLERSKEAEENTESSEGGEKLSKKALKKLEEGKGKGEL